MLTILKKNNNIGFKVLPRLYAVRQVDMRLILLEEAREKGERFVPSPNL